MNENTDFDFFGQSFEKLTTKPRTRKQTIISFNADTD